MRAKSLSLLIVGFSFGSVLLVLAGNIVIDPLWYFKGNILSGLNPRYNERVQKVNLYLQSPDQYDCFIFGSSRTTLLNENLIDGYNCFNFSFSSGRVDEFVAYAKWLKGNGAQPRLVIVGVDDFSLTPTKSELSVPEFIVAGVLPRNLVESYLSIEMFKTSIVVARRGIQKPRYYDREFVGQVRRGLSNYDPAKVSSLPQYVTAPRDCQFCGYSVDRYSELTGVFQGTKVIGYVPPVSLWYLANKSSSAYTAYLDGLNSISSLFSQFYDFSMPSGITTDKSLTYDGSHYAVEVNDHIAVCLIGGVCVVPYVNPSDLGLDGYVSVHSNSMRENYIRVSAEGAHIKN